MSVCVGVGVNALVCMRVCLLNASDVSVCLKNAEKLSMLMRDNSQ